MLTTTHATRGIVTAPNHLAAQAGLSVLRDGGNAIEAMIAAASTIAVVYPHMNAIGGDGFWLIHAPGADPVGIDACGAAGSGVDDALYRGMDAIPARGPLAANTVAGTVSGWQAALEISAGWGGGGAAHPPAGRRDPLRRGGFPRHRQPAPQYRGEAWRAEGRSRLSPKPS